ncbi:MAG: hypothetical protein ACI9SC_003086 [Gammaproteobacteria bacterium]|jgi:hypothetical protein
MSYVSIVFAFLVAGNMVAHKLKSNMVSLVVVLFTIASSILIFLMNRYGSQFSNTAKLMRETVEDGRLSLEWHPITYEPAGLILPRISGHQVKKVAVTITRRLKVSFTV